MHLILAAVLTLTHVNVVDVERGTVRRDTTLRIAGEVERTIDGRGKFVMPALWDMHAHVPDDSVGRDVYLPLFVANGVTGIRVMEGSPALYGWRDAIGRGALPGPRMVVASALLRGPMSAADARKAVQEAKREGADFVKVHDGLSPEAYEAIVREARRQRLPVAGHVPASMTVAEVSRAGQVTIEHMMGIAAAGPGVFPLLRRNRTWECPTLIMRHNYAYLDDRALADDPRLQYVRPSTRERWIGMLGPSHDDWKRTFAAEKELVGKMARAGVGILAGTDNGNPFVFPGFSLHDELALLVKAGLTPVEALRAATLAPAKLLRAPMTDFVVLDANPLEDIHNTTKIDAVIVRGRYLDRAALDAILANAVQSLR